MQTTRLPDEVPGSKENPFKDRLGKGPGVLAEVESDGLLFATGH